MVGGCFYRIFFVFLAELGEIMFDIDAFAELLL